MTDYRGRLIAARERLGLSRAAMAARLLTPRQTYEQWESGSRRTPGIAIVAAELLALRPDGRHLKIDWDVELGCAFAAGENAAQLAARIGCSPETARRAAKGRKVEIARCPSAPRGIDWDAELQVALARQETGIECARRLGVSQSTAYEAATNRGIRFNSRPRRRPSSPASRGPAATAI